MAEETIASALADPHRPAEQAPGPPQAPPPLTVDLFDPANPTMPRQELALNFDPHRHVRYENRPAVAELDLAAVQINNAPLLPEDAVSMLRGSGLTNLKAILGAGRGELLAAGLSEELAGELLTWAGSRSAAEYALAEIAAEEAARPKQPDPEEVRDLRGHLIVPAGTVHAPEMTRPLRRRSQVAPTALDGQDVQPPVIAGPTADATATLITPAADPANGEDG